MLSLMGRARVMNFHLSELQMGSLLKKFQLWQEASSHMARITDSLNIKPRDILILFGILIFLPPLALIPQIAGEPNMCGKVCPRMFFILSPKGVMQGAVSNV